MTIEIGALLPDLVFPRTNNAPITLSSLRGKNLILYFYPKDCTPGCTLEARDFRDHFTEFEKCNTVILGVSRDKPRLHQKFIQEENLPFELIPDVTQELCLFFDVIKPKNRYGKMVTGIQRSTFLIDANGVLRQEWRNVKVADHVKIVLQAVSEL